MKRQIVLDTETTGLKVSEGARVIEIGCVEIIDLVKTGRTYQVYINAGRESDPGALMIHGITSEFLADKPKFNEIVDEFLDFVKGSELIIHNSKFDIDMLNMELGKVDKGRLWDHVTNVICTLQLDKRLFPEEKKHKLDAICERFGISTEHRELHGAIVDCDLLADVFIEINKRFPKEDIEADLEQKNWVRAEVKRYNVSLPSATISPEDEEKHLELLASITEKEKVQTVFTKNNTAKLH